MIAAIILGSMGFIVFCIAIWIGYHYWVRAKRDIEDELRLLSQRLVQIQEKERQSIARELHDQIGQSLTVLQLVLDRSKKECAPAVQAQIEEGQAVVTELISTVRNISLNLRPAMLDDLGLLHTLFWHFDRYTAQTKIKVDFKHAGLERHFPPETTVTAYRIVQEALTNIVRYAKVDQVTVRAWATENTLSLRIEDKGTGFNPVTINASTSSGLRGMQERVRLLGGALTIESAPGAGTTLTAELPIPSEKKVRRE